MPPHSGPPTYYNIRTIHHIAVNHSLTLLQMGERLPETCWADSEINKIVIVASSWLFILFTYIDDARSNTNQITFRSGIFVFASYCSFTTGCIVILNIAVLISPTPWSRVLPEKLTRPHLITKFPLIVWNMKVHCCIHKSPQPVRILMNISSVHAPPSHFLKIHFNITLTSMPRSSKWSLSLRFPC